MDYTSLKKRHRAEREGYPESLSLRVHRSLSWLDRAEQCEDVDGRFIFLWIAFNAAYATEIDAQYRLSEQVTFRNFLGKIFELDTEHELESLVWKEFSGPIRLILDNQYICPSFWEYVKGNLSEEEWIDKQSAEKRFANHALASRNTSDLLGVVLSRVYTLRNQLVHGFATWNGSVNRDQLRDSTNMMMKLVPLIVSLMMDHPETLWGDAGYPVIRT